MGWSRDLGQARDGAGVELVGWIEECLVVELSRHHDHKNTQKEPGVRTPKGPITAAHFALLVMSD